MSDLVLSGANIDLFSASSGLEFREVNDLLSDSSLMLFGSSDHAAFAADKPLIHPRDTVWSYSSGTSNLISLYLRQSFKNDGGDRAYWNYPQKVLSPLGIDFVLDTDASGTFVGSSYSYATPRDWARFGLFALQRGMWQGQQILPSSWFDYATTPARASGRGEYGAQWWLNVGASQNATDRRYPSLPTDMFFASGYLGQTAAIFPSQDLVVVRLGCSSPNTAWNEEPFLHNILTKALGTKL